MLSFFSASGRVASIIKAARDVLPGTARYTRLKVMNLKDSQTAGGESMLECDNYLWCTSLQAASNQATSVYSLIASTFVWPLGTKE